MNFCFKSNLLNFFLIIKAYQPAEFNFEQIDTPTKTKLVQEETNISKLTINFADFNSKPRGWGSFSPGTH